VALKVEITRTLPLHPNGVFLQWDLVNPTESGVYCFDVFRSGSTEGPWEQLVFGKADAYNHLDVLATQPTPPPFSQGDVNQLTLVRQIYYKVCAVPPSGRDNKAEVISNVEPRLEGRFKLLKRKILRDESQMLRKLNGVDVAVLKKRRWGVRCNKCFDKYTKEVVRANCTICWGTGFTGGYFTPVITLARRGVMSQSKQISQQGAVEVKVTHVTLLDAPKVESDDVLVFLQDNKRFIVKEVMPTELKTVNVHQKLVVSELARSSVEYRIEVDPTRIPPLF